MRVLACAFTVTSLGTWEKYQVLASRVWRWGTLACAAHVACSLAWRAAWAWWCRLCARVFGHDEALLPARASVSARGNAWLQASVLPLMLQSCTLLGKCGLCDAKRACVMVEPCSHGSLLMWAREGEPKIGCSWACGVCLCFGWCCVPCHNEYIPVAHSCANETSQVCTGGLW